MTTDQPPATTYTVAVPEDKEGARLDKVLAEGLPALSRSRLQALIREGQVAFGGCGCGRPIAVTDPAYRVTGGQSFKVMVPPPRPATPKAQAIDLTVVYEDDDLIVVDKPAGMTVHPAPGSPEGTLVNALLAHCGPTLSGIGGVERPGIVHRIDKDTSGLMVVAKTDLAHRGLARQFEAHSLTRAYKALVWGVPQPLAGEVTGNIGRSPRDRKKMAVLRQGGKHALTRYRVLEAFGTRAALVECRLATGRTHQIRVHMAHIGHPLVGDPVYGGRRGRSASLPPPLRAAVEALGRQALHAFLIGFEHPRTGQFYQFEIPLPLIFNELIDALECT